MVALDYGWAHTSSWLALLPAICLMLITLGVWLCDSDCFLTSIRDEPSLLSINSYSGSMSRISQTPCYAVRSIYTPRDVVKQGIVHSSFISPSRKWPLRLLKLRLPCDILDLLELCAHLHDRVSNQAGVERHGLSQGVLRAGTRVEAHDEVVAVVVGRLQFLRWFWEKESAPIRDTAHDAVLFENDSASGFGDSECRVSV